MRSRMAITFPTMIMAVVFGGFGVRSVDAAQGASEASPVDERVKLAKAVFEQLLAQYREGEGASGVVQIDLLARWSQRIMVLEMKHDVDDVAGVNAVAAAVGLADKHAKACHGHLVRMAALEKYADGRFRMALASSAEATAAKFFRIEAEHVPEDLQQLWSQMQQSIEDREVNVVLPEAEAKPLVIHPKEMFVHIAADGTTTVSDKQLTERAVAELIERYATNNPGRGRVIIKANSRTPLEHVLVVIGLCKKHRVDYAMTAVASD